MAHPTTPTTSLSWINRHRFRLKVTLLLLLTAPCGWFGMRLTRGWIQERAVLDLQRIKNCRVRYEGEDVNHLEFLQKNTEPTVTRMEASLGKHFVYRAEFLELPADQVDEAISCMKKLPYLRKVEVYDFVGGDGNKLEIAAETIRNAMPNVETVAVHYDLNIDSHVKRLPTNVTE